ncbi:shikimate kinase [Halobacteriovorax marinus]|uniref:shikimate kinase n=1 Tax=Halobacteriovorax marinus TaxID=97084 RepID=UPI003A929875
MIIAICGFMGAGKSTFLQAFSGVPIIDLDIAIRDEVGEDLGEYIRRSGWEKFRQLESLCLRQKVHTIGQEGLIALGGGSLEDEKNIEFLKESGVKILHLKVDFDEAMNRIAGDANRPQLDKSRDELEELYLKREKVFSKCCDLSLVSDVSSWPTSWTLLKTLF